MEPVEQNKKPPHSSSLRGKENTTLSQLTHYSEHLEHNINTVDSLQLKNWVIIQYEELFTLPITPIG